MLNANIRTPWFLIFAATALAWPPADAVESVPYEDEFYEVSEAVITPHVKWAKPYAGARPRVLFIAPWYCNRHTVELVQRLECDYTVMMTTVRSRLGYDESIARYAWVTGLFEDEIEAKLRRKLEADYDVIVLGTDWKSLPLWAVYEILKKVESGTGLLIGYRQSGEYLDRLMAIGTDARTEDLMSGIPLAHAANLAVFAEADRPLFRTSSLGEGRVLQLQYSINGRDREYLTPPEAEPMMRQDYEIAMCVAIRALLWCAKAEPPVLISAQAPLEWSRNAPPERVILRTISTTSLWRGKIVCEWTAPDGEVVERTEVTQRQSAGESEVGLSVPRLPIGQWFANIRVLRDGAVAGWASLPVTVSGVPAIETITFAKELFASDDPMRATVQLSAPAPGGMLMALIRDAHGRVVRRLQQELPGDTRQIMLTAHLPTPLSIWHELRLELRMPDEDAPVAVARAEFFREWRRAEDQFSLLAWYGPTRESYMDRLINRAFAKADMDIVYPSHVWGENVDQRCIESVRAGMTILPYICWVGADRKAKHPPNVRVPCVSDPDYRKRMREQVADCARQFRRLCPAGYSLGDENYYAPHGAEYCFDEHSIAYFREWLLKKYGSIGALNRVWNSSYREFSEIGGILVEDARKADEPAPWINFRLCMEDSWSGLFSDLNSAIAAKDPDGKVGHEGSGRVDSYGAFNWWTMLRDLSLFVPYPGRPVLGNMVRSFRNPGTMSGYWYGAYTFSCGGRRMTTMRYFPWYCLFQAYNSSWYFNAYGHAGMAHEVGFAPDLRPLPSFAETSKECMEIKTGFDKLLLNSTRSNDGIAIYYSPAAIHENTFRACPVSHLSEFDSICRLLNDLSLQYDFISYAQLRDGALSKKGYRLLILPLAMTMSQEETTAILAFAKAGGAILADLPPAVADEHGHAFAEQPLVSLFGVQPGPEEVTMAPTEVEATVQSGKKEYEITLSKGLTIGNCALNQLKASGMVGESSIVLRAPDARTVLLNFTVQTYSRQQHEPQGRALRLLLTSILGSWGIEAPARVLEPDDTPLGHLETVRFTNRDATFLGIMPEDFRATDVQQRQAKIRLQSDCHVYDMRRQRYLGRRNILPVTLETCRAELFALLPYTVRSLELSTETGMSEGLRSLTCNGRLLADTGKPVSCPHVVRLTLTDPTGAVRGVYQKKELTDAGRFEAQWTLAEDDPAGSWTITATDVATGIEQRTWSMLK